MNDNTPNEHEKDNRKLMDYLVCPICRKAIAWHVDEFHEYICSSDWNGIDENGNIKPCRSCVAEMETN